MSLPNLTTLGEGVAPLTTLEELAAIRVVDDANDKVWTIIDNGIGVVMDKFPDFGEYIPGHVSKWLRIVLCKFGFCDAFLDNIEIRSYYPKYASDVFEDGRVFDLIGFQMTKNRWKKIHLSSFSDDIDDAPDVHGFVSLNSLFVVYALREMINIQSISNEVVKRYLGDFATDVSINRLLRFPDRKMT